MSGCTPLLLERINALYISKKLRFLKRLQGETVKQDCNTEHEREHGTSPGDSVQSPGKCFGRFINLLWMDSTYIERPHTQASDICVKGFDATVLKSE